MQLHEVFFSQHDFVSYPAALRISMCGVANIVMLSRLLDRPLEAPERIAQDFIDFGKYSWGRVVAHFDNVSILAKSLPYATDMWAIFPPEKRTEILAGLQNEVEEYLSNIGAEQEKVRVTIEKPNSNSFVPTFSLLNGVDARGVRAYVREQWQVQAQLIQTNSTGQAPDTYPPEWKADTYLHNAEYTKLIAQLAQDKDVVLLVSVDQARLPYHRRSVTGSKHVVLALPQRNTFTILDPYAHTAQEGVYALTLKQMQKAALPPGETNGHLLVVTNS